MGIFAEIIVDNQSSNTDTLYTYKIPFDMKDRVKIGMRVMVPFGKGNKSLQGLIINITNSINFDEKKLKNISDIIDEDPILSKELIELGIWMRREYLAQYIEVFKTIMPTGITQKVKQCIYLLDSAEEKMDDIQSNNQKKILDYLKENNGESLENLKKHLEINHIHSSIKSLINKGIIDIETKIEQEVNKKSEKFVLKLFDNENMSEALKKINSRAHKQKEIIIFLKDYSVIKLSELIEMTNSNNSSIRALEDKKMIKIVDQEVTREILNKEFNKTNNKILTEEQRICHEIIYDSIIKEFDDKFLIHGVTGSGKTEVYLQLIEKVLSEDKQAIVLIPEISLTPQTVERFVSRFGKKIAILHSKLSLGERYDQWRKIKEGKVDIAIGARSAVFAPFSNLGIIIIDEEHENSYKSSMNPKYDTIKVAEKRCELESSVLVLGSATPSINSYYLAKNGVYNLIEMNKRANNQNMPDVKIIDMRYELEKGNKSIISEDLYSEINSSLNNNNQVILFLNRRGFSTFISCRKCGYVEKCPHCDISLTYHKNKGWLKCHYCGFAKKPPEICPDCESKYIKYFGIGTQRVEEIVKENFEKNPVERMDLDTTSKKNSHEEILNRFRNKKVDILVGTQMISKGLDFPNVTLVGVVAADLTLNLPDFRASERTFQLLTQVAGRAGRGEDKGSVIIQTYDPNHYSILYAKQHDYKGFYEEEIQLRKAFNYPPFTNIISIVFSSTNQKSLENITKRVSDVIIKNIEYKNSKFDINNSIVGPNPAPIPKIKNKYRWQILVKANDKDLNMIKNIIYWVCIKNKYNIPINQITISIDINPNSVI
ncbi:primosomal protein N' [Clostridium sp. D2Q-11]|uniref:Replication restart protein PriA n=1 Tax=Anaeromonas frigoriresistens TaxID=2683708 RepID=A0A942UZM7_9FIRM|nr:primosomal protein N' [Anaeromonas frigoriresistens]MBS4539734.1 primosomal protein N' [Anaeromonas frigoriresistens]